MKISFLLHSAYAIGGTITTTFNLAGALAERHDVEIVSVFRNRERPTFTLDPRVRLRPWSTCARSRTTRPTANPRGSSPPSRGATPSTAG